MNDQASNERHGIQTGGKAVYGASVGILMLEAQFPRIPGDVGNALTWPFPVLYKVVRGASPERVVCQGSKGLKEGFIEAARELVDNGADGVTTTCGFLSLFQTELASAVDVPVATSSLMQVPLVQALLPKDRRVGILTISKASLTVDHLRAAQQRAEHGCRIGAAGSFSRGPGADGKSSRPRSYRARVHEHGALCSRYQARDRLAGVFHLLICRVVSIRPDAASIQSGGSHARIGSTDLR
jgi:hypothetical protein